MSLVASIALLALAADPKVYALIVANNRAFEAPELVPLRYADDDGAKYFEILSLTGDGVSLLSVLDADTQAVFGEAAAKARAPSKRELSEALERIFAKIAVDRQADIPTAFYFVYVGHGSIQPDGQGAMHLLDGRFTRADLFHDVIARSPATTNHVVIDACNSYFMVQKRGGDREADRAVLDFLDQETLARYPNTGVLVSTSQAAEVHEWARFSAGIFSHEVRSGMMGGADVDGDGAVSYDEMRAFVTAANAAVRDPRAKISAFSAAPALHRDQPFFSRSLTRRAPSIKIPGGMAGRYWLEDARGVRYADLHTDGDLSITVVPSPLYFLRNDTSEVRIPLTGFAMADVSQYPQQPIAIASRGSEAITFQRDLFAVPFGNKYYQGFSSSLPEPAAEIVSFRDAPPSFELRDVLAFSFLGTAAGSLALGITFGVLSSDKAAAHRAAIGANADVADLGATSEQYATTANIMYAVSGGLLAGAAGLWLWP